MRIPLDQIEEASKRLAYVEDAAPLNARLADGPTDFALNDGLEVDIEYYRAGTDVIVQGGLAASSTATCARCLEVYPERLTVPIRVVVAPPPDPHAREDEPDEDDAGLAFHDGLEVDLTCLVQEQLLLGLPTRALCRDDCRGLCAGCGVNLNQAECACHDNHRTGPFSSLVRMVRART